MGTERGLLEESRHELVIFNIIDVLFFESTFPSSQPQLGADFTLGYFLVGHLFLSPLIRHALLVSADRVNPIRTYVLHAQRDVKCRYLGRWPH